MVDEEYGAVLPEGIEVDEAAAYFGSTDSSDILEELSALPLEEALTIFFDRLSDLLLKPGEFDFETAGARLGCEGGEIYYLISGPLGLMSLPVVLLDLIDGAPGSTSDVQDISRYTPLTDPMNLLKLLADRMDGWWIGPPVGTPCWAEGGIGRTNISSNLPRYDDVRSRGTSPTPVAPRARTRA